MTAPDPRIVAITDSTALAIGLTCLPTSWDVVCHPVAKAGSIALRDAGVSILDLGDADAGLALLDAEGSRGRGTRDEGTRDEGARGEGAPAWIRAIVIGDAPPAGTVPAGATVLLRPYSLAELRATIEAALESARPEVGTVSAAAITEAVGAAERVGDAEAVGSSEPVGAAEPVGSSEVPPEVSRRPTPTRGDAPERTIFLTDVRPAPPREPSSAQQRRFVRRPRRSGEGPGSLRERLAAALTATSQLEYLIEELPLLRSLPDLADAIVEDVAEQLDADTVGLWRTSLAGWEVLSHRGLTVHEATWHVPRTHPLFAELDATGGAILVDPVDAMQAAVAGIGGAHTASFMATAIAAGHVRFGVLAVGRERPLISRDLDVLVELAWEAAPAIAVAEQLQRLQHASVVHLPEPEPSSG